MKPSSHMICGWFQNLPILLLFRHILLNIYPFRAVVRLKYPPRLCATGIKNNAARSRLVLVLLTSYGYEILRNDHWYMLFIIRTLFVECLLYHTLGCNIECLVQTISEILRVRLFYLVQLSQGSHSRDISNACSSDVDLLLDVTVSTGVLLQSLNNDLWDYFLHSLQDADTSSSSNVTLNVILFKKAITAATI